MVIIAHRISTLDLCDDLLVLDGGKVVAHGPRTEIMASENFFTSLPEHETHESVERGTPRAAAPNRRDGAPCATHRGERRVGRR